MLEKLTMQHNPSDYRAMAAMCLEVANQMSLDSERTRLTDVAQKWLELAQAGEPKKLSDAPALCTTERLRSTPHPEDAAPVDSHPHTEEQRKDAGWLLRMRAAVFKGSPRS